MNLFPRLPRETSRTRINAPKSSRPRGEGRRLHAVNFLNNFRRERHHKTSDDRLLQLVRSAVKLCSRCVWRLIRNWQCAEIDASNRGPCVSVPESITIQKLFDEAQLHIARGGPLSDAQEKGVALQLKAAEGKLSVDVGEDS